jgi:hypothetical protein
MHILQIVVTIANGADVGVGPKLSRAVIAHALGMNGRIATGVRWDAMRLNGELATPNKLLKKNCAVLWS